MKVHPGGEGPGGAGLGGVGLGGAGLGKCRAGDSRVRGSAAPGVKVQQVQAWVSQFLVLTHSCQLLPDCVLGTQLWASCESGRSGPEEEGVTHCALIIS